MQFKTFVFFATLVAVAVQALPQDASPTTSFFNNATTTATNVTSATAVPASSVSATLSSSNLPAPTCIVVVNPGGSNSTILASTSSPTITSIIVTNPSGTATPVPSSSILITGSVTTFAGRQEPSSSLATDSSNATITSTFVQPTLSSGNSSQSTIFVTVSTVSGTATTIYPSSIGTATASIPLCGTTSSTGSGSHPSPTSSTGSGDGGSSTTPNGALGMSPATPAFAAMVAVLGAFFA
ncbi:hypothetical protein CPB83DRAFT_241441 [Crepidotus variabilis]|uniref:Uncharacterized protein n=1 Tax=Crepidotus variabilis TaxID=179855 RepID=A0A9P6EHS0_9AGAR|nr:hypothetical protein CPB83DRAFT_241441 [Crepidotus variabilis]